MKRFILGVVLGSMFFGSGWVSARSYYDIDDVMDRLEEVSDRIASAESSIETTIMLYCD